MATHRKLLLLASGLLAVLPVLLWGAAAPAQQQPYPPASDDAYRPPARPPSGQTYFPPPSQQPNSGPNQPYNSGPNQTYGGPGPYNGPGQPYNGPGQPYNDPPGGYNQPTYGQQGRYDGPGGPPRAYNDDNSYSSREIVEAGHGFFGAVTQGLARVIEYAFQQQGRPNGYILGQDAGGAFVAGLRYGEGMLYTKDAGNHRVYWQGPSIGWDAGGDGSKVMVLVYNLRDPADIYRRFGGIDGSAYVVGGVGLTFQKNGDLVTAPIRTGIGLRLGANVGYLKYTRAPTWNPF
jgi:hypothetical protein